MDYPNDFNTPAFPAGSRIAVSRFMATASCVLFVVIVFMCVLLMWGVRSQRIDPFIVSIDSLTGQWNVVGHSHGNGLLEYPYLWSLQQSVVANFTTDWLTISTDAAKNEAVWKTCDRKTDCGAESELPFDDKSCSLFCISGEELFTDFIYDIVPDYQTRIANGERWVVDKTAIQMEPAGRITDNGGTWQVSATIQSNINGDMDIIAFVKVVRNTSMYPQTLGYYVTDFNAYKIN